MAPLRDTDFTGSLPEVYETYLVPVFFDPYAKKLAERLQSRLLNNVLEIAAGTGAVTRYLDEMLSPSVHMVATDLNEPMIEKASLSKFRRKVQWLQADAMQLPFADYSFDAVVCQFGVMFFPDKVKAFSEVFRVLKPGGVFLFNAWDSIEQNEFFDTVNTAVETLFPDDPPRFLQRVPYSYFNEDTIASELAEAGFKAAPDIQTVMLNSAASSPGIPAMAICCGTPLRNDIENRDPALLDKAVSIATEAMIKRFGSGPVIGKMQAKVVETIK